MSSAALHPPPHQPTSLASPPAPIAFDRQQQHPSPASAQVSRNAHMASPATASPSSRRPPSRKTSGGGPPNGADQPVASSSSRSAHIASSASYQQYPPSSSSAMAGPTAPPRTSSSYSRHSQPDPSARRHDTGDSAYRSAAGGAGKPSSASAYYPTYSTTTTTTARHPDDHAGSIPASTTMPIRTQQAPHAQQQPKPSRSVDASAAPPVVAQAPQQQQQQQQQQQPGEERRGGRSRQDYSGRAGGRGTVRFGNFILGNTIGEGEFGKVKLGWKQDSSVEVAIKLIKRDSVGSNPSRLAKIRREVTILRELQHPNIVQLIDMVETDRYIGIILEYASGGELFDYILNHRYLKDHSARRLFAQLISGVGYLHKKGIVHRDLKLENLLLDRNRNIIITDFGFANTFDPNEELQDEDEVNLGNRDYVKRTGLDRVKPNGMRKGDLMQTSCGSPCYAAPELVVSDCLYTGRKVDVWSCGVILYAMLAGYLPFDDDPANPEGDNINLLYKYIVSTPLTFPEYVTPHARDLLRRILVPNPRKRADLFEVARHSWLGEYSSAVEFITSSTTLPSDVQKSVGTQSPATSGTATAAGAAGGRGSTNADDDFAEAPPIARSSSVREAHRQKKPQSPSTATPVGGLSKAHAKIVDDGSDASQQRPTPKEAKRRTVQVEYVAPTTQTQRGADLIDSYGAVPTSASTSTQQQQQQQPRPSANTHKPPPVSAAVGTATAAAAARDKPLPRDPPVSRDSAGRPSSSRRRPQTGGSMSSAASMGFGHYGQPAPPAVADTNVEGRMSQPSQAGDGSPGPGEAAVAATGAESQGHPGIGVPSQFARMSSVNSSQKGPGAGRGHKRSTTIGDISTKLLGRSGSMFGRKRASQQSQPAERTAQDKADKAASRRYPPVSMQQPMSNSNREEMAPRPSTDSRFSRRSLSLGLGKKRSGSVAGSQTSGDRSERKRFSLIPSGFSLKAVGLGGHGKDDSAPGTPGSPWEYQSESQADLGDSEQQQQQRPQTTSSGHVPRSMTSHGAPAPRRAHHQRYASAQLDSPSGGGRPSTQLDRPSAVPQHMQGGNSSGSGHRYTPSQASSRRPPTEPRYQPEEVEAEAEPPRVSGVHRNAKKFTDAYGQDEYYRGHEGSSGAAKRVMDFFRRRGKARGGE